MKWEGHPEAIGRRAKHCQRSRTIGFKVPRASTTGDADAYQDLLAMVCAVRQPVDIIDWIYVRDIVDLQWMPSGTVVPRHT